MLNIIKRIKKDPARNLILLLGIFILSILNWMFPVIRFSSHLLNEVFFLMICIIPTLLIINGFIFKRISIKILNLVLFILPSIFFLLLGLITIGMDASLEKIDNIDMKYSNVSIYRTNGGATTDFGIVVRQEKNIFPGIILVKNLYSEYHMVDASYQVIDPNTIFITITGQQIDKKYFSLNRFVYF